MSIVLFLAAVFCGFVAGCVSAKNEPPELSDIELKLKEELVVAQNLNESLFQDLQQAKEELQRLKTKKSKGD
jgi:hypothetical protein